MTKFFLKASVGLFLFLLAGYYYASWQKNSDPCGIAKMRVSHYETNAKKKTSLKLQLVYGFNRKLKKYLPSIKGTSQKAFFSQGRKNQPNLVVLTTKFKSKKSARSAYLYLKRKWERKKNGDHEIVLKGKDVTWFRKSLSDTKCFQAIVKAEKLKMGLDGKVEKTKKRMSRKTKKKKKRVIALTKKAGKMKRAKKLKRKKRKP